MNVGSRYVLDASVFIQAHRTYYSFDICPGFWQALVRQHKANRLYSIDKVREELLRLEDRVARWTKKEAPDTFFKGTADQNVLDEFRAMVNWVQSEEQFTPEAKAEFSSVADGWLVAFAKVNDRVVVTQEEHRPEVRIKIPIPNLCIEFDVEYCNTFDMLNALNEQFVLKTRRKNN